MENKPKNLFVEVADTHSKREQGLMNRKHLPKNQGMLFKFHSPIFASFWMKNTYIPLDIAFLDNNGKVLQIESMSPLNTKAIYSNNSCKYALEVNKGWFKENGIIVGSKIDGEGIRSNKKISQITPTQSITGAVPSNEKVIPGQQATGEHAQNNPDVMMNLTYKERLKNADIKGTKITIIYQTKGGKTLPPKIISPPFTFEEDEHGHHDSVVKAWDEQTSGWKSFLVENILSMEEQKE